MVAGYAEGSVVDDGLSFFINPALVIPVLPLIIMLARTRDTPRHPADRLSHRDPRLGLARGERAQIITLRTRDFVTAAKFSGDGTIRIIFPEILPNMTRWSPQLLGAATAAIGAEAGLAFLGLGDQRAR